MIEVSKLGFCVKLRLYPLVKTLFFLNTCFNSMLNLEVLVIREDRDKIGISHLLTL